MTKLIDLTQNNQGPSVEPPEVKVGRRVRIVSGDLAGTEGTVRWMQPYRKGRLSRLVRIWTGTAVVWANDNHVEVVTSQ